MPRQNDYSKVLRDLQLDASVSGLLDLVPDLHFFIKDIDGRLIHCNSTHRHSLFRYADSAELYGKENRELFPNAMASAFAEDDLHVITTGESLVERVELNVTHTGSLSLFCTSKVPARNKRGEIVGLIGIIRRLEGTDSRLSEFNLLMPAIERIRQDSLEQMRIAQLPRECGMSEATFRREFRKLFRVAPTQFILCLRMHQACLRLSSRNEPTGTICQQVGCEAQNYFTRQFRQIMRMTPTEFRKLRPGQN